MQTIGTKSGATHPVEKIIRLLIPAGLIFGGIKLFNWLAPTLITFITNIWILIAIGIPLVMLVLYVVQNPTFIWMSYKNLCRAITKWFIKLSPIAFMERYIDILNDKLRNLKASKTILQGKRIKLVRLTENLSKEVTSELKTAKAAKNLGDVDSMNHHAYLASSSKQSLDLYLPILERMEKNINFLDKLDKNWSMSIERLAHDVARKKEEYENLREMAKALGQAEEFAKGDTEAARIYQQSVLALEETVTQKIAYIEEFEKNSKDIMKSIDIEKQMMNEEGLKLLDDYINNQNQLLLPEGKWADVITIKTSSKGEPIKIKATKNTEDNTGLLKID
jgi:hypothetical protein